MQVTGAGSDTDGASNTHNLVTAYNTAAPAAYQCSNIAIDAYGNSCTPGSSGCYSDWFLPAIDQLGCVLVTDFETGLVLDNFWSSTFVGYYANTGISYAEMWDAVNNKIYFKPVTEQYTAICVRSF